MNERASELLAQEIFKKILSGTTTHSTDKLIALLSSTSLVDEETIKRIRSVSLKWELVGETVVPVVDIHFK